MKKKIALIVSILLVPVLLVSSLTGRTRSDDAYSVIGKNIVSVVADPDTSALPTDFKTSAADGKVWADKSVTPGADNSLNIVLSALAQEYKVSSTEISSQEAKTAADVLFILDFSSSMTTSSLKNASNQDITRFEAMTEAVNLAVKQIMSANPKNRIMICWYAGNATVQHATVIPLNSYCVNVEGELKTDVNFFEYVYQAKVEGGKGSSGTPESHTFKTVTGFQTRSGDTTAYSKTRDSGTLSQEGIAYACEEFVKSVNSKGLEGIKRTPFVLFMTDGYTTSVDKDWYSTSEQMTQNDGITANGADHDTDAENDFKVAALSILTAAWQKQKLVNAYNTLNGETYGAIDSLEWFNVGIGVAPLTAGTEPRALQVMLNPALADGTKATTTAARKVYDYIKSYAQEAGASYAGYVPSGSSSDKYIYTDNRSVTYAESGTVINTAFESLGESVARLTGNTIVPITNDTIEDDQIFLTFTDELGSGMSFVKKDDKIVISIERYGKTYSGALDSSIYKFRSADGSSLKSYAMITEPTATSAGKVTWYIDSSELPLVKFASRKNPGSAYDYDSDGTAEVYEDESAVPIRLRYSVAASESTVNALTASNRYLYSNAYDSTANSQKGSVTAVFMPTTNNPYYFNTAAEPAEQKTESAVNKTANTTETALNSSAFSWQTGSNVYVISLGNNGRLEKVADITITPDVERQYGGHEVNYTIKAVNYTDAKISNAVITAALTGVTIESSDVTPDTGTKNTWTVDLPAEGSVTIKVKTTANEGDAGADPKDEKATLNIGKTAESTTTTLIDPAHKPTVKIYLDDKATDIADILEDVSDVFIEDSEGTKIKLTKTAAGVYTTTETIPVDTYKILLGASADTASDTGKTVAVTASEGGVTEIYYYTVSYVTGHGETPETEIVEKGSKATEPADPEDSTEKYQFVDWYTEATYDNAFSFDTAITKKTVLYAKWFLIDIPVKYDEYVKYDLPVEKDITVKNNSLVRVDPNVNGTYKGVKTIDEFNATDEEGYVIDPCVPDEGWIFAGYVRSIDPEDGATVFTARYYPDKVGDPDDPDKKGDGVPDMFQARVTYKIVNGYWTAKDAGDIVRYYTAKDTYGEYNLTAGIQITDAPKGMTGLADYYESQGWDKEPEKATVKAGDDLVFTYSYEPKHKPSVKVYLNDVLKDVDKIFEDNKVYIKDANGTVTELNKTADGCYTSQSTLSVGAYKVLIGPKQADAKETGKTVAVTATEGETVEIRFYTVSYETLHTKKPATEIVLSGKTAKDPGELTDTFTSGKYGFVDWYAEDTYKNEFDFGNGITKETTVYAKWILLDIPVNYDKFIKDEMPENTDDTVKNNSLIIVDPNGLGSFNDSRDLTIFAAKDEEGYVIDPCKADEGWIFAGYIKTTPQPNITRFTAQYYPDVVGDPLDPDKKGDGIPDMFQARVTYKIVNGYWTDKDAKDIVRYYTSLDEKSEFSLKGSIKISDAPKDMKGLDFYYDDYGWDKVPVEATVKAGDDLTFIYSYGFEDKVGGKDDPDNEPDGIPDKYQKRIVQKVVNGTWSDKTEEDIVFYATLLDKDGKYSKDGQAKITFPEGMLPDKGFKESAAWDKRPEGDIVKGLNEETFTYTFDRVIYTYKSEEKETDEGDILITKKLTVDPNGGTYEDSKEPTVYDPMKDPKSIADSTPAEGCEFLFYEQEEDEDGNVTLTAIYKVPVKYTSENKEDPVVETKKMDQRRILTIVPNGGKYHGRTENTVYDPIEKATKVDDPTPALWKQFTGWKYEEDADGNVTLTAQYVDVVIPATGDAGSLIWLLLFTGGSLAAILCMAVLRKRRS